MQTVQREIGKSQNGFTSEDIAQSAFTVWATCMGEPADWQTNADQMAWDRVATKAIRLIDENIEAEAAMSAMVFARDLFVIGYGPESRENWPLLDHRQQMVWNTIGRHIINCLDAEAGSVNLQNMEQLSVSWFHNHVEETP